MRELSESSGRQVRPGGWAGWLVERVRRQPRARARLVLLERIALTSRQHVALIEADGRRFLVATGPDAAPAFHALDETRIRPAARRVSW